VIGKGGGAEEASRTRGRCTCGKFIEFAQILNMRGASLRLKVKKACVQSVLVNGCGT